MTEGKKGLYIKGKYNKMKKAAVFFKKRRKIFLAVLVAAAVLAASAYIRGKAGRDVIAVVDGYRITVEDVLAELELSPEFYKASVSDNPDAVLETYINQILIYREAKKHEKKYRKNIAAKLKNYYIKTLSKEFVENEISQNIKIDEDAIAEYYNANIEDFVIPEKVRIYEIVLPSRAKAEEILRKLSYGESFETLAKRESVAESRSKSGDLGWIDVRKLDKEIASLVSRISPGEILANIVRTELGYHIIKLGGKTERRILTLSEAAPSIINLLTVKEKKREVDAFISKQKETSNIKIFGGKIKLLKEGMR